MFEKKKRMAVVRKKGKEGRMATELRGDGEMARKVVGKG